MTSNSSTLQRRLHFSLFSQDINECLISNGNCHPNAQCINSDGSFECHCDEGYDGNGSTCTDIDECLENPDICGPGKCLNLRGSFSCECQLGYMNSDRAMECIDVDECDIFRSVCTNGLCENLDGSFR